MAGLISAGERAGLEVKVWIRGECMDSINTGMVTGGMQEIKHKKGAPEESQTGIPAGDIFAKSADGPKPAIIVLAESEPVTAESLNALGAPSEEASLSCAAPGSPLFGSIGGTIAKWIISTEEEVKIGQMITQQVESKTPVIHDQALNARLNGIGQKLAANASRKDVSFTFKVLDDKTINAFACPGGTVYVNRGLLERFDDDQELAFVLAHEVAHVEHRDSIDKLGSAFVLQIIQVALGTTPGKLDDMIGRATGMLYGNVLSRKAEFKADQRGTAHLMMLGINPREGAAALRRLKKEGEHDPTHLEALFSTHPPTEERAQRIEQYSAGKGY